MEPGEGDSILIQLLSSPEKSRNMAYSTTQHDLSANLTCAYLDQPYEKRTNPDYPQQAIDGATQNQNETTRKQTLGALRMFEDVKPPL